MVFGANHTIHVEWDIWSHFCGHLAPRVYFYIKPRVHSHQQRDNEMLRAAVELVGDHKHDAISIHYYSTCMYYSSCVTSSMPTQKPYLTFLFLYIENIQTLWRLPVKKYTAQVQKWRGLDRFKKFSTSLSNCNTALHCMNMHETLDWLITPLHGVVLQSSPSRTLQQKKS